jgi:hypothetical protein
MRRVRQGLSALFGSIGHPGIATFGSWGCAALAYHAYPLATKGGYAGVVAAAFLFLLPGFLLAYWLGAAAFAFAVDAKRSCLPGSQRLARGAKLLTLVLLLPTLVPPVAALAASPLWRALAPTLLMLAIALAAIAWRRRAIQQGSRPSSLEGRLRKIGIRFGQQGALRREPSLAMSRHDSWDRQPPVRIIRTCLGGMFVQLSMRQLIVGAVLLALFILTAIGLPRLGATGWRWAVSTLTLVAAGLVCAGFLTQISKLTREQLAELALMPGLGAADTQCRALCSAVLSTPLPWLGIVLLLGSAGLLLKREPLSSVGILAMCIFAIWLSYTLFALQKLATLPPKRQSFISEFLLLYILVYGVYSAHSLLQIIHLYWWVGIILVLVSVAIASAIGFAVRRLATAPHPFLS